MTANEFTNVKDVRDCFLYTKNGFVMSYLRVYSINISLMSEVERKGKSQSLTANFENDRKDFVYFTLPREIDLERYTGELKERYGQELTNIGRRHLLAEMLRESNGLSTSGENYEHQHYIKIWQYAGSDIGRTEKELRARAQEFKNRYSAAGIPVEILRDAEILKLCNLFGNPTQAAYETSGNLLYEPFNML